MQIKPANWIVKTEPTTEPVTLAEIKAQTKITSSDEDTFLTTLGVVARQFCEKHQRRCYLETALEIYLDQLPQVDRDSVILPRLPLISVDSLKILQTGAATITVPATQYDVDLVFGRIKLNSNFDPNSYDKTLLPGYNGIVINCKAGYASAAKLPYTTKQAILLMVSFLNENRVAVTERGDAVSMPDAVKALLQQNKVY